MISESIVRAIWNKLILTGNEENLPRVVRVGQLALRDEDEGIRGKLFGNVHILIWSYGK